jgi:hypothetical protein
MKTWVGISILVVVAVVLGTGLYFLSKNMGAEQQQMTSAMIETLNIKDSCASQLWDDCCTAECNSFCKSAGKEAAKSHANDYLCTCWCE